MPPCIPTQHNNKNKIKQKDSVKEKTTQILFLFEGGSYKKTSN
jgi:hypothetical protein